MLMPLPSYLSMALTEHLEVGVRVEKILLLHAIEEDVLLAAPLFVPHDPDFLEAATREELLALFVQMKHVFNEICYSEMFLMKVAVEFYRVPHEYRTQYSVMWKEIQRIVLEIALAQEHYYKHLHNLKNVLMSKFEVEITTPVYGEWNNKV